MPEPGPSLPTRIVNGIVVTLNEADDVFPGGTVLLGADQITYVGPAKDAPAQQPGEKVIDAAGQAVLPGLVDLHYHTAIAKGWSDHLPLWEYLDTLWYPAIRALNDDDAYWAALASYCESVKCGVTTVNDMYRRLGALARAAEEIGIRAVLSNDVADAEHDLDTLDDTRAAYAAAHGAGNGRVEVAVGIEWLPLASEGLLREARAVADELGVKFHIHLNESMTEVDNSLERFGRRPTEVALRLRGARAGLRRRPLRVALGPRDRAHGRDGHPHFAQPGLQCQAGQRGGQVAGNAGGGYQRGPRPRRGRVQQQP